MRAFPYLLVLLAGCTTGGVWIKPAPQSPMASSPHCVLVAPLENLSLTSKAGVFVGELLAEELEAQTGWEVLSPLAYLSLLSQLKPPSQDPLDPHTRIFLRTRLGVDTLIVGTLTEFWYTDDPEVYRDKQPSLGITLRAIETENGGELFHAVLSRSGFSLLGDTLPLSALALEVAGELATLLKTHLAPHPITTASSGTCLFQSLVAPPLPLASHEAPPQAPPTPEPPAPPALTATITARATEPESPPPPLPPSTLALAEELASGKPIVLKGVKFKKGSLELLPGAGEALANLAELLKADPSLRVLLVVHTDNDGEPEELKRLSEQQAEALKKLLLEQYGVPASSVAVEGRGGGENIVPNTNEFLKEVNRRVEVSLLSSRSKDGKAQGSPR